MNKKLLAQKGMWLFASPVHGLEITEDVGSELKINKVTFVDRAKLHRVRKRLGFPVPISELKEKYQSTLSRFFSDSNSYAVCCIGGSGSDAEEKYLKLVREELDILSSSQLQYGPRNSNGNLNISFRGSALYRDHFMMNVLNKSWGQPSVISGPVGHFQCSGRWKSYSKDKGFFVLLKAIRGELGLSKGWQEDIKNTSILVGQSQQSRNVPQAFLWNMIAIETLLADANDTYSKALPERICAFIGWSSSWEIDNYQERIEQAYSKRCLAVHAGKMDLITKEDLLFTDHLIFNALYNVVAHLKIFKKKRDLIEFSEKIKAEKLLGIKSRITPKTVIHWGQPNFNPNDFNV